MNELEESELTRRIARIEKELKLEELHDILRKGPSAGSYGCVLHQEEIARDVEQLILSKIKWPR